METENGLIVMNLNVAATQFETLNGVFFGAAVDAFSDKWDQKDIVSNCFIRPFVRGIRELALYYTGSKPRTYAEIQKEVQALGYTFIVSPHPSLLIGTMRQLDRPKMIELNIEGKEIVMSGNEFFTAKDKSCFLSVQSNYGVRVLSPNDVSEKQKEILVLVEKK